jgi:hypothetical protein
MFDFSSHFAVVYLLNFYLSDKVKTKTTEHDYVIDMFVIVHTIATRNDDVWIRLYPIRVKKCSTRQQLVPKFSFL